MDPYWSGGTLKAPAVQKKRQATPRRKPPIASAQHPESGVRDVKVCGGQECVGWHIVGACRTIRRLTARVRASPMAQQQKRLRVCREHHRLDNKCMAYAAPGSDRCTRHHLEAFTHQRALNRRRRLCGCGAQPDPGYRTCAWCRVWSSWRKRCKRHPELELSARTQQFVRGYLEHGNAARAAREAGLGEGSGARRKGYQLLQKPHVRAAIAARSAAVLNHAHQ